MCNYHCPFAERRPCAGFLLCRNLYKDGVNYNVRNNAMNVICAHQKQCMATGRMENTDEARNCAVKTPVPAGTGEKVPAPKKGKKKEN